MQSQLELNPLRSFFLRYQSALIVVMGFACAFLLGLLLWNLTAIPTSTVAAAPPEPVAKSVSAELPAIAPEPPAATLSAGFAREVLYWAPQIHAWAAEYDLDPNLIATLIQIESCGNPKAVSSAGAQGLFQVMPFHFENGEDMLDPETNARRGLNYLVQSLALTDGHVGMAFAGYNGGHVAAQGSWLTWPAETRRYYHWGSGIYYDLSSGLSDSPTLHEWFAAGGASLCQQAAAQLALP